MHLDLIGGLRALGFVNDRMTFIAVRGGLQSALKFGIEERRADDVAAYKGKREDVDLHICAAVRVDGMIVVAELLREVGKKVTCPPAARCGNAHLRRDRLTKLRLVERRFDRVRLVQRVFIFGKEGALLKDGEHVIIGCPVPEL